jgi:hypothetical protein
MRPETAEEFAEPSLFVFTPREELSLIAAPSLHIRSLEGERQCGSLLRLKNKSCFRELERRPSIMVGQLFGSEHRAF